MDRSFWKQKEDCNSAPRARVVAGMVTDTGCHRDINEDFATVVVPRNSAVMARKGILAVIADGMGGHQAGEVASRLAAETVEKTYYRSADHIEESLHNAFLRANYEVHRLARRRRKFSGMGTTCTALALNNDRAYVAHVGDSRLYLVRNGSIYQMTEDHTAVMELVRQGVLSISEARNHEDRSVLLRALGTHNQLEVSLWAEPLEVRSGDRFVLCSDGLYDLVQDDEILDLATSQKPQTACASLVSLARARGGYDNITVVIVSALPVDGQDVEEEMHPDPEVNNDR